MNPGGRHRRRFLQNTAALAGLALQPAQPPAANQELLIRRAYGRRSSFESSNARTMRPKAIRRCTSSWALSLPSSLHYVVSHGYEPPEIDPREHRLLIHGLVDSPPIFTMDELKRLPSVSQDPFHRVRWKHLVHASGRPRSRCNTRTGGRAAACGRVCSLALLLRRRA